VQKALIDLVRGKVGVPLAACVLTGALICPTTAAAPALSIKTKFATITVEIDSGLDRYPGLDRDCLAEGRNWAKQMLRRVDKGRREDPASFQEGRKWPYSSIYKLRSIIGRYVSVVRSNESIENGAHPVVLIGTVLWDRETRRRISIRRFFTETVDDGPTMTALAHQAQLAVAAEKIAREIPARENVPLTANTTPQQYLQDKDFVFEGKIENVIKDRIRPAQLKIGPVTLAPSTEKGKSSGLTFHYSAYELGPYVDGPDTAFVPWTAFRHYLSADGAAIFGGERPKRDADRW